jgi:hypothetical protein
MAIRWRIALDGSADRHEMEEAHSLDIDEPEDFSK